MYYIEGHMELFKLISGDLNKWEIMKVFLEEEILELRRTQKAE